jgi:hypothetical protein
MSLLTTHTLKELKLFALIKARNDESIVPSIQGNTEKIFVAIAVSLTKQEIEDFRREIEAKNSH